jgi:hypothetical protein
MAKLSAAEKEKRKPKFLKNLFKGRRAKTAEAASKKGMAQSAMKSTIAKAEKKYAAESMFKSAKSRDDAKVKPGKARSFKEAFNAATKADKDRFMHKGKSYLTTKGKRKDRFPVTTDKKKAADKKESIFSKFKSSATGAEFLRKLKKNKC